MLKLFTHSKSEEKLTAENIIKTLYDAERLDMQDSCYGSLMSQEAVEQGIQANCLSRMAISRYNLRLIILDIALQIYGRFLAKPLKNKTKNSSSNIPSKMNKAHNMERSKRANIEMLYLRSVNAAISKFKVSEVETQGSFAFIPKNEARNMPFVNNHYNQFYGKSAGSQCSHEKRVRIAEEGSIEH